MLKLFKNHICPCFFIASILCFTHTVESHAIITNAWYQEGIVLVERGKNTVIQGSDMAVIRDVGALAFGKTEDVSASTAFCGFVSIVSLLYAFITGNLVGIVIAIASLVFQAR
ncbi:MULTISPECIES: hypothetical protein [unclassified Bartonella]|uniref:hypothetical protein n=1 Tax=unclassified Bartonella TaxID=2645622 RepID=UPI00300DD0FF